MEFKGAITAMVTPFTADGVDLAGLKKNVQYQLAEGINGLVPLGTTGESPTVSESEREQVIRTVVAQAKGKVPIIVGTGTNSTKKTIEHSRQAQELGADAVLIVSPYYNKPTQEGLYRHFTEVADAIEIPIIVYNIAGRTAVNIETGTLKRMAEHKNIVAVKEASGNLNQMTDVVSQIPDFTVLSGDDSMTLPLMAIGGKGVISVVSNLLPGKVAALCKAAASGDYGQARKLHYELLPIYRAAFVETNPAPIKTAMRIAGMPAGPLRMPMTDVLPKNGQMLKSVVQSLGFK